MNIFLLRRFNEERAQYAGTFGFGQRDNYRDRCLIQTKPFETAPGNFKAFAETVGHEIGHLLNLSVHKSVAEKNGSRDLIHDWGLWPFYYYAKDGTLLPQKEWDKRDLTGDDYLKKRLAHSLVTDGSKEGGWRWIRHDDWVVANDWAWLFENAP